MQATTVSGPIPREASTLQRVRDRLRADPAYQAFVLMRVAPWIHHLSPLSAVHTMHIVGVIEIAAGIAVAIKPRYAAYVVAAWLAGIIVNLLSYSGYYDVALRDFGLMLAALTLARLASKFDPPGLNLRPRD
jgi:uncharacterized membrane protein YphA (DoxX/SURF4 family)